MEENTEQPRRRFRLKRLQLKKERQQIALMAMNGIFSNDALAWQFKSDGEINDAGIQQIVKTSFRLADEFIKQSKINNNEKRN